MLKSANGAIVDRVDWSAAKGFPIPKGSSIALGFAGNNGLLQLELSALEASGNGEVIARGHNKRVQEQNPILHGEMDCLNNAGRIGSYRDTVIYSTLMPCYMCAGTIVQSGGLFVVTGSAAANGALPDSIASTADIAGLAQAPESLSIDGGAALRCRQVSGAGGAGS